MVVTKKGIVQKAYAEPAGTVAALELGCTEVAGVALALKLGSFISGATLGTEALGCERGVLAAASGAGFGS